MVRIAQVNMYLHQFKNPQIFQYDTLTSEERWNDKYDVILANPPFKGSLDHDAVHKSILQTVKSRKSELLFLGLILRMLKPGGRLSVISYHSLEDRLVKDFMKTGNFEGEPEKDFFGNLLRPLAPLKSKPIIPAEQEIQENTRARSAKLRVATKL